MASPNESKINIAKEQSEGVLPNNPNWLAIRNTGTIDIGASINTVSSKELRQDRQFADVAKTSESSSGSIPFELSPNSHDALLEGVLFNSFSQPVQPIEDEDGIALTIANGVAKLVDANNGFLNTVSNGDWIKISGFSNEANNGFYQVLSSTRTELVFKNTPPNISAEGAGQDISIKFPARLRNGVQKQSFSVEQEVFKNGNSEKFQLFKGVYVNELSLDINTESEITGSFGLLAKQLSLEANSISGVPVLPNTRIFSSNNVLGFSILGIDTIKNFVSSSSISINNGVEGLFGLGIKGFAELPSKQCTVEASFSVYLNDMDLIKKARAAERVSLSYILNSDQGDYIIDIPAIILGGDSGKPQIGDIEGYVTLEASGSAIADPELGYQIGIYKL